MFSKISFEICILEDVKLYVKLYDHLLYEVKLMTLFEGFLQDVPYLC